MKNILTHLWSVVATLLFGTAAFLWLFKGAETVGNFFTFFTVLTLFLYLLLGAILIVGVVAAQSADGLRHFQKYIKPDTRSQKWLNTLSFSFTFIVFVLITLSLIGTGHLVLGAAWFCNAMIILMCWSATRKIHKQCMEYKSNIDAGHQETT